MGQRLLSGMRLKAGPASPHTAICAAATPQIAAAKATNGVVGVGAGGAFGIGAWVGVSASASVSLVADPHGKVGLAVSFLGNPGTIGGGVVGAGVSAGGSITLANTTHISDLNDTGTSMSGSAGGLSGSLSLDDPATLTINVGGGEVGHVSTLEVGGTAVPESLSTDCSN